MIEFTPAAIEKIAQVLTEENDPSILGLRIFVEGGGCSGFQYGFGFADTQEEDDNVYELDGSVKVYVDMLSEQYLTEVKVDYVKTLMSESFVISNPAETSRCGCGSSFSV